MLGMTQLVKYDAAKKALAEAKAVDEVKQLHDVASAMKAYAVQAKDKQLEIDASEIRIRAERRLGEMLREQKETVGMAPAGRPKKIGSDEEPIFKEVPTLAEVGIDKKLSSRAQQIASIPEADFEDTLAQHREEQQAVTNATMGRLAKVALYTHDEEWYTPDEHIERARRVLGTIDVDPASNDHAQKVVKATTYYTRDTDGLSQTWPGKVWLNPPYQMPEIKDFVSKLVEEYKTGNTTEAILLTTNATDTSWWILAANACDCLCFTRGRVRFYKSTDVDKKSAPPNGHCFFYFGENREAFVREFITVGTLMETIA